MNNRETLLKSIQWEIDHAVKLKNTVSVIPIEKIDQAFPEATWEKSFFDVRVCLPMSFALIDEVKMWMAENLPEYEMNWENQSLYEGNAYHKLSYRGNFEPDFYVDFEVVFKSELPGAACVVNKIGEETKLVPIYEVVCSQEAADEF